MLLLLHCRWRAVLALLALTVCVCSCPHVRAEPIPWCSEAASVQPLPAQLLPVTGVADDQCQHLYFASLAGGQPSVARVDPPELKVAVWNKQVIPPQYQTKGFNLITDLDWFGGTLYVPAVQAGPRMLEDSDEASNEGSSVLILLHSESLAPRLPALVEPSNWRGVIVRSVVLDYTSRLLYAFPASSSNSDVLVLDTNNWSAQPSIAVHYSPFFPASALRGALMQSPKNMLLLFSSRRENAPKHVLSELPESNAETYTLVPLDLNTGKFGAPQLNITAATPRNAMQRQQQQFVPNWMFDAAGLAPLWDAPWDNMGVLHAADAGFLYNYAICDPENQHSTATKQLRNAQHAANKQCKAKLQQQQEEAAAAHATELKQLQSVVSGSGPLGINGMVMLTPSSMNETLVLGSELTLRWQCPEGREDRPSKMSLIDVTEFHTVTRFSQGVPCRQMKLKWTMPADLDVDLSHEYQFWVAEDNILYYAFGRPFRLTRDPSFKFLRPTANSVIKAGSRVTVEWRGGLPQWKANVYLINNTDSTVLEKVSSGFNTLDEQFVTWLLSPDLSCSDTYRFYIEDDAKTKWSHGPSFRLVGC